MTANIFRRHLCFGVPLSLLNGSINGLEMQPIIEVWKSRGSRCGQLWIAHVEQHGFAVKTHNTGNSDARTRSRMPAKFGGCLTARVEGYVVEGHVPAPDIIRMLKDKPDALGVAVPGMPMGRIGMGGQAYGFRVDPYDVLLVTEDGEASVFASHR